MSSAITLDTECCVCTEAINPLTNPGSKKHCGCSSVMCVPCSAIYASTQSSSSRYLVLCPVCRYSIKTNPVVGKMNDRKRLWDVAPVTTDSFLPLRVDDITLLLRHASTLNGRVAIYCTSCRSTKTPPRFNEPKGFVCHLKESHDIN